jgi:hypothetical protein
MFGISAILAVIASLFIEEDLRRSNFKIEEISHRSDSDKFSETKVTELWSKN